MAFCKKRNRGGQSGVKPRKRWGQHFLVDRAALAPILSAAELDRKDIVVEVGPGLGILTVELAKRVSRVIAVEIDSRLIEVLRERLGGFSNLKLVHCDILQVSPEELVKSNLEGSQLRRRYKVVANLPYYITSPILRHFLETELRPARMVIMVQKEVGELIAASPGDMGFLSVMVQFYSKPTIVAYVPATSFYPPPRVDSVILRLDVYSQPPIAVSDVAGFFDFVKHGFSNPRKQLRNSLAHSLQMVHSDVVLLLEKAGIDPRRRAETLSLEEWGKLWDVFLSLKQGSPC